MDYSPPYNALLSFATCPLMPYACLFACSNALACEMDDVDRRVRLALIPSAIILSHIPLLQHSITSIPRERLRFIEHVGCIRLPKRLVLRLISTRRMK